MDRIRVQSSYLQRNILFIRSTKSRSCWRLFDVQYFPKGVVISYFFFGFVPSVCIIDFGRQRAAFSLPDATLTFVYEKLMFKVHDILFRYRRTYTIFPLRKHRYRVWVDLNVFAYVHWRQLFSNRIDLLDFFSPLGHLTGKKFLLRIKKLFTRGRALESPVIGRWNLIDDWKTRFNFFKYVKIVE